MCLNSQIIRLKNAAVSKIFGNFYSFNTHYVANMKIQILTNLKTLFKYIIIIFYRKMLYVLLADNQKRKCINCKKSLKVFN